MTPEGSQPQHPIYFDAPSFRLRELESHPEEAYSRLARRGKTLNPGAMQIILTKAKNQQIVQLGLMYLKEFAVHGNNSVAHLCLDPLTFFDVTVGEDTHTIEETRRLLAEFPRKHHIWYSRDPAVIQKFNLVFKTTTWVPYRNQLAVVERKIKTKLDEWDAIP